ncbi:MAG: hypothetical protein IPN17_01335 [Deltaproteobacteria bacterium]|nr:hypothetical protein [Deltaproteobacteria bacterium]
MKTVVLDGSGNAGLAAYRRLRDEGARPVVCAPPGDLLAQLALAYGALVDPATATFVGVFAGALVEAHDPPTPPP